MHAGMQKVYISMAGFPSIQRWSSTVSIAVQPTVAIMSVSLLALTVILLSG